MAEEDFTEQSGEDELFEHHRIVADKGQGLMRMDKFLTTRLEHTSRTRIQAAHDAGFVRVNGAPVKSSYKVKPGDVVTIELPYPLREIELRPEPIPLHILFEDEEVCVLNKPAGLVVHPGYGNYTGTLVNALLWHFDQLPERNGRERPGLVHRLDKNTSGVMVVAKTESAMIHLARQFFERTIERRYLALVWGDPGKEGTIEGNLGRSLRDRKVMDVFKDGNLGKPAVTHFKSIESFGYTTLVECKLETGRTHQIRVHMKHVGHPLFNDPEYGGNRILKGTTSSHYKQFVEKCFELLPRQALHAASLGFTHPVSHEWLQFTTELPVDMEQVVDRWRNLVSHRR